jgi:hypothetical protein
MSVGLDNLLSGAAGAALVALITVGYTEIREARQRVRAAMGYARLLDAEIEANGRALEVLQDHSNMPWEEYLQLALARPPSIEIWTQVRAQLAPLIKPEHLAVLDDYYRRIELLLAAKERPLLDAKEVREQLGWEVNLAEEGNPALDSIAHALERDTPWARGALSEYANPPRRARWLGL